MKLVAFIWDLLLVIVLCGIWKNHTPKGRYVQQIRSRHAWQTNCLLKWTEKNTTFCFFVVIFWDVLCLMHLYFPAGGICEEISHSSRETESPQTMKRTRRLKTNFLYCFIHSISADIYPLRYSLKIIHRRRRKTNYFIIWKNCFILVFCLLNQLQR